MTQTGCGSPGQSSLCGAPPWDARKLLVDLVGGGVGDAEWLDMKPAAAQSAQPLCPAPRGLSKHRAWGDHPDSPPPLGTALYVSKVYLVKDTFLCFLYFFVVFCHITFSRGIMVP